MDKKRGLSGNTKGFVRRLEALLETAFFCALYYGLLRLCYLDMLQNSFTGAGTVLLIGFYGLITALFTLNTDGFQFGNLRRFDLAMAQWISLLITNVITYFQLCLLATRMVNPLPLLALMGVEILAVIAFVYLFSASFHWLYKPYNMILVFGSESAVSMKISTRSTS